MLLREMEKGNIVFDDSIAGALHIRIYQKLLVSIDIFIDLVYTMYILNERRYFHAGTDKSVGK